MSLYLILTYKNAAKIGATTREFNDEVEMQKYIDLKTKAGIECHKFDYSGTFVRESHIVKQQ